MTEERKRRSRVLEYLEAKAQEQPDSSDPLEGLEQSFGFPQSGKE